MRKFRYSDKSDKGCSTMTRKEIVAKLMEYPEDMPVFATWEGVNAPLDIQCFEKRIVHKGNQADACECLVYVIG